MINDESSNWIRFVFLQLKMILSNFVCRNGQNEWNVEVFRPKCAALTLESVRIFVHNSAHTRAHEVARTHKNQLTRHKIKKKKRQTNTVTTVSAEWLCETIEKQKQSRKWSTREKMLSSLVKDHQAKQAIRKEEQGKLTSSIANIYDSSRVHLPNTFNFAEHKRKEAVVASSELTQALVDHLNVG